MVFEHVLLVADLANDRDGETLYGLEQRVRRPPVEHLSQIPPQRLDAGATVSEGEALCGGSSKGWTLG